MQCLVACEWLVSRTAQDVLCLNSLVCNWRWLEVQEHNGWHCYVTVRGECIKAFLGVCYWLYGVQSKQKLKGRVDSVLTFLDPQILHREKETQCLLSWTPVSPVLTGCLSWESAACAQGEKEQEEQGRGTRKKTEGGREETLYPLCQTPPLLTPKGNPPTAMPLSSPWQ